jgi:hypothetical protein
MKNIKKILCLLVCTSFIGGVMRGAEEPPDVLFDAIKEEDTEFLQYALAQARTGDDKVAFVTTKLPEHLAKIGELRLPSVLIKNQVFMNKKLVPFLISAIPEERRFDLFMKHDLLNLSIMKASGPLFIDPIPHEKGSLDDYNEALTSQASRCFSLMQEIPESHTDLGQSLLNAKSIIDAIPQYKRAEFVEKNIISREVLYSICRGRCHEFALRAAELLFSYADDLEQKKRWVWAIDSSSYLNKNTELVAYLQAIKDQK